MTVKDLIEELQKYDADNEIIMNLESEDGMTSPLGHLSTGHFLEGEAEVNREEVERRGVAVVFLNTLY